MKILNYIIDRPIIPLLLGLLAIFIALGIAVTAEPKAKPEPKSVVKTVVKEVPTNKVSPSCEKAFNASESLFGQPLVDSGEWVGSLLDMIINDEVDLKVLEEMTAEMEQNTKVIETQSTIYWNNKALCLGESPAA